MVATGNSWGDVTAKAEIAVTCVIQGISDVRLKVAVQKTEALFFYGRVSGKPPMTHIRVGEASILVRDRLKYLDLLLDGMWSFEHYFDALVHKIEKMAAALDYLLPNLRGPDDKALRIYMETVNFVALYGAPVWAAELAARRNAKDALRRIQRRMAARVTRS